MYISSKFVSPLRQMEEAKHSNKALHDTSLDNLDIFWTSHLVGKTSTP
jgi:hypothetical protein